MSRSPIPVFSAELIELFDKGKQRQALRRQQLWERPFSKWIVTYVGSSGAFFGRTSELKEAVFIVLRFICRIFKVKPLVREMPYDFYLLSNLFHD